MTRPEPDFWLDQRRFKGRRRAGLCCVSNRRFMGAFRCNETGWEPFASSTDLSSIQSLTESAPRTEKVNLSVKRGVHCPVQRIAAGCSSAEERFTVLRLGTMTVLIGVLKSSENNSAVTPRLRTWTSSNRAVQSSVFVRLLTASPTYH